MGLEDFERELAKEKSREAKQQSQGEGEEGEAHKSRHRHHHHHRSHRHRDSSRDRERGHRHKRHRDRDENGEERRHRKRQRSDSPKLDKKEKVEAEEDVKVFDSPDEQENDEDDWVEKETLTAPPEEDILDQRDRNLREEKVQRDAWMQEPSALNIDYVQSKKPKPPPSQFVTAEADHGFKMHGSAGTSHSAVLQRDLDSDDDEAAKVVEDEPAQHEVSYTFGDAGSSWRMTKLQAVYRQATESGRGVDEIALERYGDLRDFDDAREEERELERRSMYGDEYVGREKPSGELFQERKMRAGVRRESSSSNDRNVEAVQRQGEPMPEQDAAQPAVKTAPLDPTALNKLKAQLMKAKLRNAPNSAQLEEEYKLAEQAALANAKEPDVVVLSNMENRMLAGSRSGEVTAVSGKRGRERGLVVENEDMSIEDMVKQERRSRGTGGGDGRAFAERIAKDGKFTNDLDYMDENAEKLSKKVIKSDTHLRSAAIGDFQRTQRILDTCPLCYHEDKPDPAPAAPIVSLATRTYLTLPTTPSLAPRGSEGAVIVPVQHRRNLLECDSDEWEELRNFMKSLTRHYDAQDLGVVFYENAAHMLSRGGHAALVAVPLPRHVADLAPAYFKEAILSEDERWSQHKPIIDTLALSQKPGGFGKQAFRKAMVPELPYFHVWFSLDGGMGHVVEDERRWPKGDLFAREVLGGMLGLGPEVVKKQGRWERGSERKRVEAFRKRWGEWDWTKVLMET